MTWLNNYVCKTCKKEFTHMQHPITWRNYYIRPISKNNPICEDCDSKSLDQHRKRTT
jgi:DNA-directed RNA polymerase subunit RPC12/RpoP